MELLGRLKLAGMRAAYDELVAAGLRAQHPFQRIFGELLRKHAVSTAGWAIRALCCSPARGQRLVHRR